MTFSDFMKIGFYGDFLNNVANGQDASVIQILYIVGFIFSIIAGYLLGSINSAIIISKTKYCADIRTEGSKNAGATNMLRTYGIKAAVMTFLFDACKTIAACVVGVLIYGLSSAYLCGFMCIVGHIFPVFYHFRGGKGVVCVAMLLLLLDPLTFAVLFVIFIVILLGMKYMSLASVMSMMLYPIVHRWMIIYIKDLAWLGSNVFAVLIAVLIIWRHYPNMKRLLDRTESKMDIIKMIKEHKANSNSKNTDTNEAADNK